MYGLHPWDLDRLTDDEISRYVTALPWWKQFFNPYLQES